jgi:hypothetical protein
MEAKGGTFGDLLHRHGCLFFTIALCARDESDGWNGEATGRMEREFKGGARLVGKKSGFPGLRPLNFNLRFFKPDQVER